MRNGKRAVYKGKEYEYITTDDIVYKLFVRKGLDAPNDFEINEKGNFQKFVNREELEEVYYIRQFAKYKGHTLPIWESGDEKLLLGEGSYTIANELEFAPSDLPWERGLYKKWVPRIDIEEIVEERTPL